MFDRAREALRQCLPDSLRDQSFASTIRGEESVQRWLSQLIKNLNGETVIAGSATASDNSGSSNIAQVQGKLASAPAALIANQNVANVPMFSSNIPTIASGGVSGSVFGYSNLPLASANWNS